MTNETAQEPELTVRVAALCYAPGDNVKAVLDAFITARRADGVNVHGLRQEDAPEHGKDAVDIRTGERTALKRPSQYEYNNRLCSLDLGQLAAASQTLRRARDESADLVVVERFGKAERAGNGLADDLLDLMASNIPTLVTVPIEERDAWERFTGGLGNVLACDGAALNAWWQDVGGGA